MSLGVAVGPGGVGIGLRAVHHGAFLSQSAPVDFVEVHAEIALGQVLDMPE